MLQRLPLRCSQNKNSSTLQVGYRNKMDIPNACVAEMPIHKGPVLSVRFNHSGDYCISCGADRVVKLLNPHKALLIKTYRCFGVWHPVAGSW